VTSALLLWIVGSFFATLGVYTFIRGVVNCWRKVMSTANDLAATLKDATEIARAYREDLGALRTIAQASMAQNLGEEPESIIPRKEEAQVVGVMPPPLWDRFPIKPKEQDAPLESVKEVDVTATEEELAEQDKGEQALDFEAQERQKAATREADQQRLKEMAEQSAEPEGK